MSRKYVYSLLAAPFLLALIALAVTPANTRATFFTEFEHRTKKMLGIELPSYDELGPDGLEVEKHASDEDDDDDDVGPAEETEETEEASTEAVDSNDSELGEEEVSTDERSTDEVTTEAS